MAFDVVSLGELLIDFTPVGVSENGNPVFERNPGGGPANFACAVAKLGGKAAFIGKVGNDNFGRALREFIGQCGVDTSGLLLSDEFKTTLAFVHLDASGDRSFSFYRKNGADTMLRTEEVDLSLLDSCPYFFCSSVMMAEGESRRTSFDLMRAARDRGCTVYFDPNLRMNLWESPDEVKRVNLEAIPLADIVKISEEEIEFLTGDPDYKRAARAMKEKYGLSAILVTLGAKGCFALINGEELELDACPVKAVDTTAAGDSFNGGFLYALCRTGKGLADCSAGELRSILKFANTVGGLTTTKKGAICALPSLEEVEQMLEQG